MKLSHSRFDLRLKHTFTIARGSRDVSPVVIVELEHDGITGFGEAAPSSRYGETVETVEAFLGKLDFDRFEDPFQLETILDFVDRLAEGNTAAKASVDIALHDWHRHAGRARTESAGGGRFRNSKGQAGRQRR